MTYHVLLIPWFKFNNVNMYKENGDQREEYSFQENECFMTDQFMYSKLYYILIFMFRKFKR